MNYENVLQNNLKNFLSSKSFDKFQFEILEKEKVNNINIDLKNYIKSLKLQKFYLRKNKINVLTGLNGSGKTHLLEYINNYFKQILEYMSYFKKIKLPIVKYIPVNYIHSGLVIPSNINFKSENVIELKEDDNSEKEINFDFEKRNQLMRNYSFEKDILNLIYKYKSKYYSIHDKTGLDREQVENSSEMKNFRKEKRLIKNPIDVINEFLKDEDIWNLKIQIYYEQGGDIFFKKDSDINKEVKFNELSTGEKVAFLMSLWQFGSSGKNEKEEKNLQTFEALGKRPDILIIDEFDANLNPSLIKKYVKALKKYFVEKGTCVIISSHNPLTVNACCDENLIWMKEGEIDKSRKINEIINNLSDDLISSNELFDNISLMYDNDKMNNNLFHVLVEDLPSKRYLELAFESYNKEESNKSKFNNLTLNIIPCHGEAKIFPLACIKTNNPKIAIFDNDLSEDYLKNSMKKRQNCEYFQIDKIKFKNKEIDTEIEHLFDIDFIRKYEEDKKLKFLNDDGKIINSKNDFLEYIEQKYKNNDISFENFYKIFDNILSFLKKEAERINYPLDDIFISF